jgi:hypothetical protein
MIEEKEIRQIKQNISKFKVKGAAKVIAALCCPVLFVVWRRSVYLHSTLGTPTAPTTPATPPLLPTWKHHARYLISIINRFSKDSLHRPLLILFKFEI